MLCFFRESNIYVEKKDMVCLTQGNANNSGLINKHIKASSDPVNSIHCHPTNSFDELNKTISSNLFSYLIIHLFS